MLIALAAPAVAHDADFEEAWVVCLWLGYEPDDEDFWYCVDAYLDWHDGDHDEVSADDSSADDGSGYGGYDYYSAPYGYGYYW